MDIFYIHFIPINTPLFFILFQQEESITTANLKICNKLIFKNLLLIKIKDGYFLYPFYTY